MRPAQGVSFGGRYELDSRIAIGGMGEVWEATDHVIGRTVAIKILKDEYMGDPGFLERFRAEARHAALVNHEGIASVFDYGEENGSAFLVMELVPGEALSTILEREGTLSTDKTLDVVAQTSAALQAAHAAGLVHRDIKPGNLLITPDGRVKITDFGIARIADQVPLTATGQVMGTVQYLSPEQASGHPASPATDIYSLGIVAYESLAGKRPFTGESQVAIAMAQINDTPPPLPATVPGPVQQLVLSMIAKKPADRPPTAAAVARAASALRRGDVAAAAAIVPAIAGTGAPVDEVTQLLTPSGEDTTRLMPLSTATAPAVVAPPRKRSPWTWPLVALIALLLIVLGGTVFALINSNSDTPEPPPTSPSPTVTPTPTPTATPTPTPIAIESLELVGKTCDEARAAVEAVGATANCETGDAAFLPEDEGKVYRTNPFSGNLVKDDRVTLTVYSTAVDMPAPTEAPSLPGTVTAGTRVDVSWPAYACPTGAGEAHYNVFVDGGDVTMMGATSAQIEVTGEGQLQVSYTVTCRRDDGATRETSASPTATASITPATPTPTPDPMPSEPSSPEPTPEALPDAQRLWWLLTSGDTGHADDGSAVSEG
ncbi:serine/threonine-protein kinase [Microbacterium sp. No. 7]|uniref:serine/threonine-protein kinase n=1 Tax=Microbacterium sp. No. 7 TaxID=1714373 RepID=UPI0009EBBD38|nr:serine/threonine-protein kinase [Microbacterium sp. No. 7]